MYYENVETKAHSRDFNKSLDENNQERWNKKS